MARAFGSYPKCPRFESRCRYQTKTQQYAAAFSIWPVGQVVKTPPFHGGNMGSSPVRVTKKSSILRWGIFHIRTKFEPSGSKWSAGRQMLPIFVERKRSMGYNSRIINNRRGVNMESKRSTFGSNFGFLLFRKISKPCAFVFRIFDFPKKTCRRRSPGACGRMIPAEGLFLPDARQHPPAHPCQSFRRHPVFPLVIFSIL